jgi:hypothetical protein
MPSPTPTPAHLAQCWVRAPTQPSGQPDRLTLPGAIVEWELGYLSWASRWNSSGVEVGVTICRAGLRDDTEGSERPFLPLAHPWGETSTGSMEPDLLL